MQIDETRRDSEAGRIDLTRAGCARGVGRIDHRGYFAIFDRDVGLEAGGATAVDHDAIANDYVIFHAGDYSRLATLSANDSTSGRVNHLIECGTHRGFRTSLGRGDPCTQ